jgi:hypothetical protein
MRRKSPRTRKEYRCSEHNAEVNKQKAEVGLQREAAADARKENTRLKRDLAQRNKVIKQLAKELAEKRKAAADPPKHPVLYDLSDN